MRFDELENAVGEEVPNLHELRQAFSDLGHDPSDMDRFASWLHDRGEIETETFRSLSTGGTLVIHPLSSAETFSQFELGMSGDTDQLPIRPKRRAESRAERFEIIGKLAEGAMGEIHVARDHGLQRKVAIKRMSATVRRKPSLAARFYAEAQITAQLAHPGIVPVYSLEQEGGGGLSYTMKLVRGRTFKQLVSDVRDAWDAGTLPPEELSLSSRLDWFIKVCDALAYAHSRGVVHRDLKPDNIMVGAFGEVFVMDWGIARILGSEGGEADDDTADDTEEKLKVDRGGSAARTRVGTVIGTPAYMSPEQAMGDNARVDAQADQFALGLILFELCCLKQAMTGRDTMSILLKCQRAQLEPLRHHSKRGKVPAELAAIIRKATRLDRAQRYETVQVLADDVRRFQRGDPTLAMPDGLLKRFYRWIGRNRELALVTVLFMLTVAGSALIGALGLNLYTLQAAEIREQRLTDLVGITAAQSHVLDGRLLQYQGLLKVLSANAVEALSRNDIGHEGDSYFLNAPRRSPGKFDPPDLVQANRYDREVSLGWPVMDIAEGVPMAVGIESVRHLTLLRQPFRRLLLSSYSEEAVGATPAQERQLILQDGTPVVWAYVALQDGAFAHYPGHAGFPPRHDARKRPWYKLVEGQRAPRWGNPHVDIGGLGLMLPCSMALYDDEGLFMGVAGIELAFDWLIENLLLPEELEGKADSYVVDSQGRVVISSADRDRAKTDSQVGRHRIRLKNYRHPAVLDAVRQKRSGKLVVATSKGRRLVTWGRMDSIGWTYIVEGALADLL